MGAPKDAEKYRRKNPRASDYLFPNRAICVSNTAETLFQ